MKLSAILAPMIAAGVDGKVILETVKAFEAAGDTAQDEAREKARARWHKWNDKRKTNGSKRLQTAANVSNGLVPEGAHVEDITSNLEDTGSQFSEAKASSNEPRDARRSVDRDLHAEFEDRFWPLWPEKIGKKEALVSFLRQRKAGVALNDILGGVERYVANKPLERQWMGAAKFLNQERWLDEAPQRPRLIHSKGPAPPRQSGSNAMFDAANQALAVMRNG